MLKKTIFIAAMALSIASLFSSCASKKGYSPTAYQQVSKDQLEGTALFVDATREKQKGNDSIAAISFQQALQKNPEDAASMYELSKLYEKQGQDELALKLALKASNLYPKNQWYLTLLADLYKKLERYDNLVNIYQRLLKIDSYNPETYNNLAVAYLLEGKNEMAIATYNDLEKEIGVNEFVTTRKAKVYEFLKKPEKALEEYQKLADAHPYEIRNFQLLAEYASSIKDFPIALEAYKKIEALNPEDPYVHISLADYYKKLDQPEKSFEELKIGFANPKLDANTKIQVMVTYYTLNQIIGSALIQATQLAAEIAASDPENAKAWAFYGNFLFQGAKKDSAFMAFRQAQKLGDKTYGLWENMLFTMDMKIKDAEQISDSAIMLFPNQPIPYLYAGLIKFQKEKNQEALKLFLNGQKLIGNNSSLEGEFFALIGDVYHSLKDEKQSFEYFDKALKINPDNSVVLNNYAYYLSLNNEKLEQAKEMSAKAVELDPENASNLDTHAWVLFLLGEYDDAKKYILMAIAHGGKSSPTVLEHCGDILYKLDDPITALQYWKWAKEEGSKSKTLDQKIQEKKYIAD